MPDRRISTPAIQPPTARSVPAAAPTPLAAPAAQATGDHLAVRQPAIEADIALSMRESPVFQADGSVKLSHSFLLNFVRETLSHKRAFPEIKIDFDPAAGGFAAEGKLRWGWFTVPFAATAKPVMANGKPGVEFDAPALRLFGHKFSLPPFAAVARKALLDALASTAIQAKPGDRPGLVELDANSLLRELAVIPSWISLDQQQTRLDLNLSPQGDLTVYFDSPENPPLAPATPRSDLALKIGPKAAEQLLARVAGNDYRVTDLKLRDGGATVSGQVDVKPVSDLLTLTKSLLVLGAYMGNNRRIAPGTNVDPVEVRVPMAIEVALEGRTLVLKPSIAMATKNLIATLQSTGIAAERQDDTVRLDLDDAAKLLGAELGELKFDANGVRATASVDVTRFIRKKQLLTDWD